LAALAVHVGLLAGALVFLALALRLRLLAGAFILLAALALHVRTLAGALVLLFALLAGLGLTRALVRARLALLIGALSLARRGAGGGAGRTAGVLALRGGDAHARHQGSGGGRCQ